MNFLAFLIFTLSISTSFAGIVMQSNFSIKFGETSEYGDAISSKISNDGKIVATTGNPSDSTYGRNHVFY
jgi:hypothetical protein